MKLSDKQIEKAVVWWADQVAKPTFNALSDEERKDSSNRGMMFAECLASMNVKPVTQKQHDNFVNALRTMLKIESVFGTLHSLYVDYGPCTVLRYAAEIADISQDNFPWKTDMIFDDNRVRVRLGYDGEWKDL